ncbi:hypothetical protein [Phenylobacterium sp.]|uniref:hypothetical protein n=1 Tax=Phenylobacterium sp. TaxID=1871053 RepID=UPI0025DBF530|nr:hypothetical protein [Phenylobacterium sp.]
MKIAALALLVSAAAGSACAETAVEALMAAPLKTAPKGLVLDVAPPRAAFSPRFDGAPAPRIAGVAKTAVDHRFDDPGVVGSLGFLCGLEAGAERQSGAAAMRGYDPSGRFVGAKLRLAFR